MSKFLSNTAHQHCWKTHIRVSRCSVSRLLFCFLHLHAIKMKDGTIEAKTIVKHGGEALAAAWHPASMAEAFSSYKSERKNSKNNR